MKNISIKNSTLKTSNYVCEFGKTRTDQEILSADSIKFSRNDIKSTAYQYKRPCEMAGTTKVQC